MFTPSAFNPDCDARLDAIVAKCIEIPLHRRYQSAEELGRALTEWQQRTKPPVKRTPLTEADASLTDLREQAAAQRLADEAKRLASLDA